MWAALRSSARAGSSLRATVLINGCCGSSQPPRAFGLCDSIRRDLFESENVGRGLHTARWPPIQGVNSGLLSLARCEALLRAVGDAEGSIRTGRHHQRLQGYKRRAGITRSDN